MRNRPANASGFFDLRPARMPDHPAGKFGSRQVYLSRSGLASLRRGCQFRPMRPCQVPLIQLSLCSLLLVCASRMVARENPPPADFVITNANVLTVDGHFSRAQAVAVCGDRLVAVGRNRSVARLIG